MKGRKKRKPIAHRVIAFVLAFAMIFTSISFSDVGTAEAKAAMGDAIEGYEGTGTETNPYIIDVVDGKYSEQKLAKDLVALFGATIANYGYQYRVAGSSGNWGNVNAGNDTSVTWSDGAKYEVQKYVQTGSNTTTILGRPITTPVYGWVLQGYFEINVVDSGVIMSVISAEVPYNFYYDTAYKLDSNQLLELKQVIAKKVLNKLTINGVDVTNIDYSKFSIKFLQRGLTGDVYDELTNDITVGTQFGGSDGTTESVTLVYTDGTTVAESAAVRITLKESRQAAIVNKADGVSDIAINLESLPENWESVLDNFFSITVPVTNADGSTSYPAANGDAEYKVTTIDGNDVTTANFPSENGSSTYKLTINVDAGNNNLKSASYETTFTVTNPEYPFAISTADVEGVQSVAVTPFKDGYNNAKGSYTISVTPESANGYYVDCVKIGNTEYRNGNWSNGTYTVTVDLENAPLKDSTTYVVTPVVGNRVLEQNTANLDATKGCYIIPYTVGGTNAFETAMETLFKTAVGDYEVYANDEISYSITAADIEEGVTKNVTIKVDATNVYPETTLTVPVQFTYARVDCPVEITVPTDMLTIVSSLDEVKDDITVDAKGVEYTITVNGTLPKQGEEQTVTVTVSTVQTNNYNATTVTSETFKVVGKVTPAKVIINAGANGTIDVDGKTSSFEISTNGETKALPLTVTPSTVKPFYIDTVTLNGATINGEQETVVFTSNINVVDGKNLALGVQPTYTVAATYNERTIVTNALPTGKTNYEIGMNGFYSVYSQHQAIEAEILSDIVNANETLGYADSEKTIGVDGSVNVIITTLTGYRELDYGFKIGSTEVYWGNEVFSIGEESVQITLAATGKYPAVTGRYTIEVVDSRPEVVIKDNGSKPEVILSGDSWAAVETAALAAAGLTNYPNLDTDNNEITYTYENDENVTHSAYTEVKVTITVGANEAHLGGTGSVIVKVKTATVNSTLTTASAGTGSGSVGIYAEADTNHESNLSSTAGGKLTVVATPATNGSYVEKVTVTDKDGKSVAVATGTYASDTHAYTTTFTADSNNAYTVTVTYGLRTFEIIESAEVEINGYYEASGDKAAFATLRDDVLKAVGLAVDGDYSVSVQFRDGFSNIDDGIDGTEAFFLAGAIDKLPETRDFQITLNASKDGKLPAVTKTVQITLKESRTAAVISQVDAYKEVTLDVMPTDLTGWYSVVDPNGNAITSGITATLNPTILPAEGTEDAIYTLSVSVSETADYLGKTAEYTVLITNPQYDAEVNVTQPTGAEIKIFSDADHTKLVDTSKLVPAGKYYVTVTPTEDDVYVTGLSSLGASNVSWNADGNVYSGEITIEYGATESKVYDISAVVGTRQILINEEISKVVYTDAEAELLKGVYTAAVAGSLPTGIDYEAGNVTVALKEGETLTKNAENTFVITWAASDDGQYPQVSTEVEVYISEARVPADINVSNVKVEGEGILMITEEETNEDGTLTDETKAAIVDAISGIVVSDGAEELVLSVDAWPNAPVQAGKAEVTVKASVAENDRYLANEATFVVTIYGDVSDANVTIADVENGTVTISQNDVAVAADTVSYKAGTYTATLTPAKGYFIDTLVVTLDGVEVAEYTYDQFVNGQVPFEVINGAGKSLGYTPEYTLTATFVKPAIVIEDSTVNYQGEREAELPGLIWNEVYVSANPTDLVENAKLDLDPTNTKQEVNDLTVYYLAREAATYTETITVKLPIVGNYTFTADIPVGDQWLEISQEVPVGAGMPTQDEIQAIVDDLLEEYDWQELANMGIDGLKDLAKEELEGVYEEYYRFYNAHTFGMTLGTTETVKVVYNSERFGAVESGEAVVTLADTRPATEIKLNTGVEMTYGFTEDELTAKLLEGVYADGNKIDGAKIQYVTKVEGLNASEEAYTIKVLYDGGKQYKHSTAETTIIVNKAPVDVKVDNRLIKWREGLTYDLPVATTPAGVDTINFIVGLDVSDINVDGGQIKGIMGEVQLMIPDSLQDILSGVGIKNGVSMTVGELQEKLLAVAEGLGYINSENEVVNVLINMLESLPTDVADVTVRVGGEMPTNIGVYLVGAVSADGNYETNFGVGAVVITPDGKKAELDWIVEDDNSIITRTLLTSGTYDMGAKVVSVAEGSIEEAEKQVVELFLGVDIDGNIKLETDQTKLNVGAYTEVAMIANWGNEMYYSEPIIRAFVVIAETLDLKFIDENGDENNERLYEFDNTAKKMEDIRVSYKDTFEGENAGKVIIDTVAGIGTEEMANVKFYYVGAQTNVNPYLSTEPPVHAGAYTVTAVYTQRDADNMVTHVGINVGALVIEQTTSDTSVENGFYEYEKGTSHVVNDLVTATSKVEGLTPDTTVISAGITTDGTFSENAWDAVVGTVNVDLPTWLDDLFKKYDILEAAYTDTGITASTFKGYVNNIEELLTELNISVDAISELEAQISQMSDNTTLTFKDNVAYENVGAYLVVGVVTDSDHYPSVGAGLMVIYPDATEVDLAWNEVDWNDNYIYTWDYLQKMDHNASAFDKGTDVKNAEATAMVDNFFLGVTDDGKILLTADKAFLDIGAYTQFAYLLDLDAEMYYAKPIVRPLVVIPNIAEITFVDETGTENADRHFVFDNTPHAMDAVVTLNGEVVENPGSDLAIYYAGVQTNGAPYASKNAPVHAGAYTATAIYSTLDDQGRRVAVGMEVGAMVIEPAESDTAVANGYYKYEKGTTHSVSDLITTTSAVEGITPDTTVISAGITTDGTFSDNAFDAVVGTVNVDMPTWLDELFVKYNLFEAGYTKEGISAATFLEYLEKAEAILAELDIQVDSLTQLKDTVAQMDANTTLTFVDDIAYENVGAYLVVSVVTDSDHYPSVGAGLLVIYPDATEVRLAWDENDWNGNNMFTWNYLQSMNVGASAYNKDTAAKNTEATEMVDNFFLGVTDDGEILLTDNKANLDIGAYTQFAYLLDIDSAMYYAKPISRVLVVVPNVADITFVDETGAANDDRHFVYDCNPHAMDVVVTINGEKVDTAELGDDLTVTYTGVQSNGKLYNSTDAPIHTGAYTVTAIVYTEDDQGRRITMGIEAGAMVIEAAQSSMDVVNKTHEYSGTPVDTHTMLNAVSAANDPDLDTTVITAALATNGNFSEEGLGAIEGAVNIDLPDYVDAIAKQVSALEAGYNGSGLVAADFINILKGYEDELSALQITKEIYDGLMNILEQLPANATVTFKEQAEVAPTAIGAYLVIGMVTDTNHYPSMDAGMLVIYPNAQEAELEWIYEDSNNIFTLDALEVVDLGAAAYYNGVKEAELQKLVENIFIGVNAEDWTITLTDDQADLKAGIYTEMSYLDFEANSYVYYAEPISRVITVVPNMYNVNFVDENGDVNNDRLFTFDNTPKSMGELVITDLDGNVITPAEGTVTMKYLGADVSNGAYVSSEAPTHVGAYTVVATYVGRDANDDLAVGVGMGAMVIQPADADVNVDSQVVVEGNDYTIGVTATPADYVVNDTPKTLTILAGVDMDEYAEKGNLALDGVVNVDFPTAVDDVLKGIVPEWYEHGIGTNAFFARYDEVVAAVEAAGIDTTMFTELKSVLTELNAANLTFGETEEVKPTATGVYAILAMVFDPDYTADMDTALLVIAPDATVADLEFKMDIPGAANIIPYEWVEKIDFGAQVENIVSTNPDVTADDVVVKDVIFGITTDFEIFIGSSEDKPTELGVYDQVAYAETGSDFALVLPINRAFTVIKSTANVEFYDGEQYVNPTPNWLRTFVYDGEPQDMPARLTLFGGEVLEGKTPNVWYLGMENDIVVYSSDVAPTDVGAYQAIGYYFNEVENIYTVGLGAMVITPREVTVTVDDQSMVVNEEMPKLTYKVDNEATADPLKVTVTTEADGTVVGEFPITATVAANPNYKVVEVVDGTLTVAIAENEWTEAFDITGWTYGDTPNAPTGKAKFGTVEFVYTGTTAAGDEYNSTKVPTQAGDYTLTATVEGTDDYTGLTASKDFTIEKKDVTITVTDQTIVYGTSEPDYTCTIDGLVAPDTLEIGDYNRKAGNKVGTYWIDVEYTPNSNYDVTVEKGTLTITKAPLTVTVEDATKVYGEANPEFTLDYDGFKHGDDAADLGGTATFTCDATTTSSVGTYDITVEGLTSDNYDITYKAGTLTINPAALPAPEAIAAQTYTGSALTPAVVINGLTAGTDYTVEYADNTAAGEATVTITGKGNYTGTQTVKFTINPAALPAPEAIAAQTYTGSALTPAVVIDGLTAGTDYTVEYADNTAAGEATVTITGKGNYTGTQTVKFTINPAALPAPEAIAAQTYTGSALTPAVVINGLTAGTDYTVEYADNTAAGEATVTITGKGNYTGTQTVKFTINPKDASNLTTEAIADQTYTGNPITPSVVVKDGDKVLTEGTDYTVSYTNNTKPGTATITITGKGNYTGTTTATFTIAKTIDQVIAELSLVDVEATGAAGNSMYIRGFTVGETTASLKARLSNIEGATLKSFVNEANAATVATGMEFTLTINGADYHRVVVVMGDTNGDGNIWATDYTLIKNQIMTERVLLVDEYRIAADINRDDNIYATDYTAIKNYIMNDVEIDQSGAIRQ